jgi:Dolichyl-phosphate-mannose-protein mannosyltransferase
MTFRRLFWPLVALILTVLGVLEMRSALGETQTWDEGIHISAGYAYLTRGDYSWNIEHPPLVKMLCALPLRFLGLDAHPYGTDGNRKSQIEYGVDFLYRNRRHADTILITARSATMLLSLLFLAAFAWWVRRRFGTVAALLATILCAFDPNLIAHGRYITTDVPLTACYFFACVLCVEYLERGGGRRLLIAAVAVGIAMVVKFSAVLLGPPLVLLYAIRWFQKPKEFPVRRAVLTAATTAAVLILCIGVVYGPETVRWARARGAPPRGVQGIENDPGPFAVAARKLHVAGHAYILGLNQVVGHNEGGHESYLLGIRSNKGWWYYFPVVFAVKSTIAALVGALIVLIAGVWRAIRAPRTIPFLAYGLALPPLFYFGFSMTSGINLGMRHILPIYPFLYVGAAAVLASLPWRRAAAGAMIALGALQVAECASITPDYLAFFNALAGGPGRGPEYLVDSNIDWGQDVKKLVRWLDAHGTRRARVYYFGNAQLRYYGVDELGYPEPLDQKGWDEIDDFCVANVTPLYGVYAPLAALAPLRMREPVAKIGWSMYVYDLRKRK